MAETLLKNIRNVAILGGAGAGKTTVVEAMAFASGLTNKLGTIEDGNTLSDFDKEEIKRHCSIQDSMLSLYWEDCLINVIDTPGMQDMVGERESALLAADAAVIIVNGKNGVDAGTIKAWELCDKFKLPRIVFVTAMDDDNASYRETVEELTNRYGRKIAPFHQPIRENGKFVGYVNITKMNGRRFTGIARYEEIPIPDYSFENLEKYRETLIDSVAGTNDDLMDKYFNEVEFTQEEIDEALKINCCDGTLVPVTMGSGKNVHGVFMLLNDIVRFLPAPTVGKSGVNVKSASIFDGIYERTAPLAGQIFKTYADPFIGSLSLIKVYSGVLKKDSMVYNSSANTEEKITRLYKLSGKELIETDCIEAGDIGAIPKLLYTSTGDTLSTKDIPCIFDRYEFAKPYTVRTYNVIKKSDEDKVSSALQKMCQEDMTLELYNDVDNKQQLIKGIGTMQLDIVCNRLENRYKINIELKEADIAYKETILKSAEAKGRYKKQSGGHGQFGEVVIELQPLEDTDKNYEFEECVVGGAVPKNYFPAVEKGIAESIIKGPLKGYPVVGIKAILKDGSYHPVDSSEMAFKTAAMMAFEEAYKKCEPVLLEPIANLSVNVPEKYIGDVTSDLKKRRGRITSMLPDDYGNELLNAQVPLAELSNYGVSLRSCSAGYGEFSYEVIRYERVG